MCVNVNIKTTLKLIESSFILFYHLQHKQGNYIGKRILTLEKNLLKFLEEIV